MKHIPVIILGSGGVGRALLRQILTGRGVTASRNDLRFDLVAVTDSRSWLWAPGGLEDGRLRQAIADKYAGRLWGEEKPAAQAILEQARDAEIEGAILVDVTAASDMEPTIDRALSLGFSVVLANKKPLAGPWEMAQKYFNDPRIRFESTVGGGQPVIAALRYLLDTGDPIYRIEGQMSGTMGHICGLLNRGIPFSSALAEAKDLGITEPDPREDLGGLDVMRKIMILGRLAGWPLEEDDITVETLVDPSLAGLPVSEFMRAVVAMDDEMRRRVEEAQASGSVLCHTAEVLDGRGRVGLAPIERENPLARLKYVGFWTGRYSDQPLMIGGKGAGVEMTAAGVVGDMIALAREVI